MIEVDEALRLVLDKARPLAARRVALADALGLVLAEDVTSDVDSPPYDKAMVDGYAVLAADLDGAGGALLDVLEEVMAGDVPKHRVEQGQATRIMTGAPTPPGSRRGRDGRDDRNARGRRFAVWPGSHRPTARHRGDEHSATRHRVDSR